MSPWLFLSLVANILLIFWLAKQKHESDNYKWSADFWHNKKNEWQDKYYHERDNKDW